MRDMKRGSAEFSTTYDGEVDEIAVAVATEGYDYHVNRFRRTTANGGILTPVTSESETPRVYNRRSGDVASPISAVTSEAEDSECGRPRKRQKRYHELSHIVMPGPAYPPSIYHGWAPASPVVAEADALKSLLQAHNLLPEQDQEEFIYFQLDDFCVYQPDSSVYHSEELVSLDRLSQDRFAEFRVDGYLSAGDRRHYVQNIPFRILTIDGYGDVNATHLAQQICLQSPQAARAEVWYKLGTPSSVYRRFYDPFLWLARFTKHFVDYLLDHSPMFKVTLSHFRRKFFTWLHEHYQDNDFYHWLEISNLQDFRTTVAAHVNFLYKECHSIDDSQAGLCRHPIWREVGPNLTAIREQESREMNTVVTPYAFDCFNKMYFGEKLVARQLHDELIKEKVVKRKQRLGLTPYRWTPQSTSHPQSEPDSVLSHLDRIEVGDVVCVRPELDKHTWNTASGSWFAYIQGIRCLESQTLLDVLWVYEPCDTTIGKAHYPFSKELFLSDNCACGKEALDIECVVSKVSITWFATDPYAQAGYFVRQKFRTIHEEDTYDFVTLSHEDFKCRCGKKTRIFEECCGKYSIGDTVLVREWSEAISDDRLQPAQIIEFDYARRRVMLRRFVRKAEDDPTTLARSNELKLTNETFSEAPGKIVRRCHVRSFRMDQIRSQDIPTPYDRDGAGDFYYFARDSSATDSTTTPSKAATSIHVSNPGKFPYITHGLDPTAPPPKPKLAGMGIFCGGGTFDRGIEEGGAATFRYAVDWATPALHSYRANVHYPDKVQYFLGSVNDYLGRAMAGDLSCLIAGPGDIDLLTGGSPCPGFSLLQSNKLSEESKQNASMVASVVSFVDFYSPRYLILENVVTMTCGLGPNKDQNVFSQIIAALVGLGYQVQQFLGDAWSYGSSQQRSRVFIVASAPGLEPHAAPPHSHSHPVGLNERALGKSSNGKRFGNRRNEFTAFQHGSARQAVEDLPYIGDSQPQLCPAFPDHRTARDESHVHRTRMAVVPIRPCGIGLAQANQMQRPGLPALVTGEPHWHCANASKIRSGPKSKMYARVYPDRLFPTIVTRVAIGDGINGQWVHWDQHRSLTVMETRRAQGYLDEEVLVGTPAEQLKIVGNSVDRKVALMLGLALRESWMGSNIHSNVHDDNDSIEADSEEDDEPGETAMDVLDGLSRHLSPEGEEEETEESEHGYEKGEDEGEQDTSTMVSMPPRVARNVDNADSLTLDNRTAKIALHLNPTEIEEVRRDHFKAIRRILDSRHA